MKALLALMNVEPGIWDRLTRVVICLLLLAGLIGVVVWYLPLIHQNERMRQQLMKYDAQIQLEAENYRRLKSSIDALEHDPKTVERVARETLGYAKPGETVIRFEQPPSNTAASR